MNIPLPVSANTALLLPVRNTELESVALCAGSDAATMEVFDGTFGTAATIAIGDGGTGYEVGDVLTLVSASGGVQAVVAVATVDGSGVVTGVTLTSGGTGYVAGSTYATTTDSVAGVGATITVSTVTNAGASIAKLACAANTSAPPVKPCVLSTNGISVKLTGTSPKGHIYYE